MSWLPGRKASTAAAHTLMFARTKGERPWFTPCLLALKHVFKLLLHSMYCVVSAAYLHALSWEGLTLCKPGCSFSLTVFCDFPGLELLKEWCVKGYHTGAGTDLAQMVRIAVGEVGRNGCLPAQSWVEILLVLLPLAAV